MTIRINGKEEIVDKPKSLADLICAKGLIPEHIVVEYNFSIVPAAQWSGMVLQENDNVEIISFVGGG